MEPAVTSSVAIVAESTAAEAMTVLQHTRQTLDSFAVPMFEGFILDRSDLPEIIAELESTGAAIFIVVNTSADPLSAAVSKLTIKPVLTVPVDGPGLPAL